jgi:WD40 repeat protein
LPRRAAASSIPIGERVKTLTLSAVAANDVAYSPDGKLLAGVADDGTVMLWDASTWQVRQLFLGNGTAQQAGQLAFTPDSAYLADTATSSVRLWSVADGSLQRTFQTPR